MKYITKACLSLILTISILSPTYSNSAPESNQIVFEITDKYNEIRFGLTESTVYMIFSERIKRIANESFDYQYKLDVHAFEDSDGNFINGSLNNLDTNIIELSKDNISEISFKNGKLNFTYQNKPKIGFDDIYSHNGTKAIENFYIEDLEKLILTFYKS